MGIISKKRYILLNKQKEFISKTQHRYFKTSTLKVNLFNFWDEHLLVDDKVIKSKKHYIDLKKRVCECGNFLDFKVSTVDDKIRLTDANFCKKDKICLACSVGRAYNQQKKFFQILDMKQELVDKYWYYIVTPVRHSVSESIEIVYERVSLLRKFVSQQIRDGRRGKNNGFWSQFNGGMGSIETTRTCNGWNVHINWLVNSDFEVDLYRVADGRKIWYQNRHLEAFLRRFNDSYIHSISKLDFNSRRAIKKNLLEVLKYSLKFSSLEPKHLVEIYYILYRKHLFFTFGNLRGLNLENVEDISFGDDFCKDDDFIRLIYKRLPNLRYELNLVFGL